MKKALTVANVLSQTIKRIAFTGLFYQAFREPQDRGVWFSFGGSGSGKSTFILALAKEFAKHEKTFYNLLEEETNDSDFIERMELLNMNDVKESFSVASYDYEELLLFLDKRNSPKVVVIDSAVYFFKNFEQYLELKKKYKNKIFLITGHAVGNNPRSELERSIMYDAKQKIFCTAYLAICRGRTIGPNGGTYIIWDEGYEKARGTQELQTKKETDEKN